jgi:hypothetical protein
MYRQGDVLIVPIEMLPADLEPVAREGRSIVLARGEATGHAHVITDERAIVPRPEAGGDFHACIRRKPIALEHDEHDAIAIPPGEYRIVRQREYTPNPARLVAD